LRGAARSSVTLIEEGPMVLAYHLIFTTYGFWLPNDPRGSWSDFVRSWELFWYGSATKVTTRASLARKQHDQHLRRVQKSALQYDPVIFTPQQILAVAQGFARAVAESGYVVFACSILPRHVHLVVQRHRNRAEQKIGHSKTRATQQFIAEGIHPFMNFRGSDGRLPQMWAHRGWKVYLDSVDDILRAIAYVENNPVKEGRQRQTFEFVTPYERRFDAIDPGELWV
jgi:REP element-mobilizing transposase RayT